SSDLRIVKLLILELLFIAALAGWIHLMWQSMVLRRAGPCLPHKVSTLSLLPSSDCKAANPMARRVPGACVALLSVGRRRLAAGQFARISGTTRTWLGGPRSP